MCSIESNLSQTAFNDEVRTPTTTSSMSSKAEKVAVVALEYSNTFESSSLGDRETSVQKEDLGKRAIKATWKVFTSIITATVTVPLKMFRVLNQSEVKALREEITAKKDAFEKAQASLDAEVLSHVEPHLQSSSTYSLYQKIMKYASSSRPQILGTKRDLPTIDEATRSFVQVDQAYETVKHSPVGRIRSVWNALTGETADSLRNESQVLSQNIAICEKKQELVQNMERHFEANGYATHRFKNAKMLLAMLPADTSQEEWTQYLKVTSEKGLVTKTLAHRYKKLLSIGHDKETARKAVKQACENILAKASLKEESSSKGYDLSLFLKTLS